MEKSKGGKNMKKNDEVEFEGKLGIWRTIGGRRVFIRTGQSLGDAMRESGKFPSYRKVKEKRIGEKVNRINEEENELNTRERAKIREYMEQGMSIEDAVNKADKEFNDERNEILERNKYNIKEDIKGARGTQEKSQIERFKNAKTKEEAYKIMREGYKEDISKSRMTNRNDMVAFIKEQTNIDISNYIEERAGHSRTYLGVHLEKMPINQQNEIKNLMAQKGVMVGDNGGYGYALYYKKNKK